MTDRTDFERRADALRQLALRLGREAAEAAVRRHARPIIEKGLQADAELLAVVARLEARVKMLELRNHGR